MRELQDEWYLIVEQRKLDAEEATRGNLFRRDREHELAGLMTDPMDGMFLWWNSNVAYYFASTELVDWWEQHPRTTFAEYAYDRGVRSMTIVKAARKAAETRQGAAGRARGV